MSKQQAAPAAVPRYVSIDGIADATGISKRKAHQLRHEPWWPAAIELGPRTLRWDLNEVLLAMQRHARRTRVGAEPAALATSRSNRSAG